VVSGEVVPLLQQLIRNGCVNDGSPGSGHEHRSVSTLADYLGEKGTVVEPSPGRQSVIYRVPGRQAEAPRLLLLPHLDVVPANPSGWSVDPFAAEIADGFVWGRGAVDMLNLTAAMTVVFGRYLRGELPPLPGDLILAAVADEEAAGGLGAQYLVEERWDLVAGEYLLTEVAYPSLPTADGPAYPVSVGEKGPHWTLLRTEGTPGHGSAPFLADNALQPMAAAVTGLFETPSPVVITDNWRMLVKALGLAADLAERLVDPERIDEAISELAVADPWFARYAHAVTHLTVSPNQLAGGVKANIIADRAVAQIDLRSPEGVDRRQIDQHLRKAMGAVADRVNIEPVSDFPATNSTVGNPLWQAVGDGIEALTGSKNVMPITMPVATDARFFRARDVVAYGVGLFDDRMGFSEFLGLFHGNDERISVASLERTVELLSSVLARFGELTATNE
jgi:acetylornithine deacetylase/succinyl-diaminopimelate desuccinylase-like protein